MPNISSEAMALDSGELPELPDSFEETLIFRGVIYSIMGERKVTALTLGLLFFAGAKELLRLLGGCKGPFRRIDVISRAKSYGASASLKGSGTAGTASADFEVSGAVGGIEVVAIWSGSFSSLAVSSAPAVGLARAASRLVVAGIKGDLLRVDLLERGG